MFYLLKKLQTLYPQYPKVHANPKMTGFVWRDSLAHCDALR